MSLRTGYFDPDETRLFDDWFKECFGEPAGKRDYYLEWRRRFESGLMNAIAQMDYHSREVFLNILKNKMNLDNLEIIPIRTRPVKMQLAGKNWVVRDAWNDAILFIAPYGAELVNFLNNMRLTVTNKQSLSEPFLKQLEF